MNITPQRTENSRTVTIDAYGLPGFLNDCCVPEVREYLGNNLQQIVTQVVKPFGIKAKFVDQPQGGAFEKVESKPGEKALDFLIELARKRRLLITDDPEGNLVFYRPEDTAPTADITEGVSPLHLIKPVFNAQEYYSHITGIREETSIPKNYQDLFDFTVVPGGKYTAKNKFLKGVYRPYTFTVDDTNTGNLKEIDERKNRLMLANAISYEVQMLDWLDETGRIWIPYKTIGVTAPGVMIYNKNNFHIRSVSLRKDERSMTATLVLAVHGSFGGNLPEKLPWE
jgi:prophage tail gpP-like protein